MARPKGSTGGGAIQEGRAVPKTYYHMGPARFTATPKRDTTGDRLNKILAETGLTYKELLRRIVAAYERDPDTFDTIFEGGS